MLREYVFQTLLPVTITCFCVVSAVPAVHVRKPVILSISPKQIKTVGDTLEVECSIRNDKNYPVLWTKQADEKQKYSSIMASGTSLVFKDNLYSSQFDASAAVYKLQIKDIQEKDEGTYECMILTHKFGTITASVKVQVLPKQEEKQNPVPDEKMEGRAYDGIRWVGNSRFDSITTLPSGQEEDQTSPAETVQTTPTEAIQTTPIEVIQTTPTEVIQTTTTKTIQTTPTEVIQTITPTEAIQTTPTEAIQTTTTEAIQTTPTEATKTTPAETMEEIYDEMSSAV